MKKWEHGHLPIAILLSATMILAGCGEKEMDVSGDGISDVKESLSTNEFQFLDEVDKTLQESMSDGDERIDNPWVDNALDDFSAVINLPIDNVKKTAGEISVGGRKFVCEAGFVQHEEHRFQDSRKSWDQTNRISLDGKKYAFEIEAEPDREGLQVMDLGPISGRNGYVACFFEYNEDNKPSNYCFYELDENFRKTKSIQTDLVTDQGLTYLMGDANGYYHVIYRSQSGKNQYVIVSAEGKRIFERQVGERAELHAFDKGRVCLCEIDASDLASQRKFYEVKSDGGGFTELAVSKNENLRKKMEGYLLAATPLDDYRMAWCARDAVYVYDTREKEAQAVYKWSNHGISPIMAECMTVTVDGFIEILYKDASGLNYILLKPTLEKKELISITFAVSPFKKDEYEQVAALFHKKFPEYVINVKSDYDKTALLTQLGAGDGPVLIDTELTGFDELEHLWQPMDGFLEQTDLVKEMIPETLSFGKIGDTTYGIVRYFRFETLITAEDHAEWNYKGFLNSLESFDGAALTYQYIESTTDWREKYFDLLKNGISDNYYFDAKTDEMIFGTPEFERVLMLSQKAAKCPPGEDGMAVQQGKALCEHVDVVTLSQVLLLRRRVESSGEQVTGYPTRNGAKHLLAAVAPIVMRSTATEEQKKVAYTFFKVLLSKEAMTGSAYFPVRKDAMEQLLQAYEETVKAEKSVGRYKPNYMPELDREKDVKFLEDLIQGGVVKKALPASLESVFDEEFDDYLSGRIDGKALADHLKSRVTLYLEESK